MPAVTRFFVNRSREIEQLNAALQSGGADKDSCVQVYGQRGIGKTQLLAKYMRECNYREIRTSHTDLEDLITKGYLGLIESIVEGLGDEGFEDLDKTFDDILIRSQIERSRIPVENAAGMLAAIPVMQGPGFTFQGAVTGQNQTFITGDVTYHNAKIENIYHFHLAEPEQVAALIQSRITRSFRSCLQDIAREHLVVILLDHWDKAGDPLQRWLDAHLLTWATDFTLKKVLVVVARETLPSQLESQLGVLPLALPPFNRDVALEFWKKNGLAEEEFNCIGAEVYSIPFLLTLEVGRRRFGQAIK